MTSTTPATPFPPAWTLLSLVASVALLISFVWVVSDFTQLGMQRQQQQRATGVWMSSVEAKDPVVEDSPTVERVREPEVLARM